MGGRAVILQILQREHFNVSPSAGFRGKYPIASIGTHNSVSYSTSFLSLLSAVLNGWEKITALGRSLKDTQPDHNALSKRPSQKQETRENSRPIR